MGLSLRPYFLCRGEGGGGGGLSTSPGPSNPPAANQASATSSSNQSSTSAPHSPYGPLPYDISFGNHSGMSNSECTVQMGAMGYFSEFNSGVADGFFDFFGDIRDAAFDPVGSLSGLWNDFRNAPFRFTLDNIVFSPFNPTTPLRNAFTGFRDDGVHGLGNAFGQHAAVVTSVAAVYVACKSVGSLNAAVVAAVTGTFGQGAKGPGNVPKIIYNSIRESSRFPSDFQAVRNGMTKHNINNQQLLNELRAIEPGKWQKVYKDGYSNGQRVSIHFFESPTGRVFDVAVKPGWSNPSSGR